MTAPAVAAARTLWALALGAALGLWYGFLRPLRPRHTSLSDLLFVLGWGWAWVFHSFGVCQGDPRIGYLAAMAIGALTLDRTLGRVLAPLFRTVWTLTGKMWAFALFPIKKTFNFMKKVLHM